mgnify:CR=1 FL=1
MNQLHFCFLCLTDVNFLVDRNDVTKEGMEPVTKQGWIGIEDT